MYFLKLALRPWKVAFFSELLMTGWLSLLLVLVGFFGLIDNRMKPLIKKLSGEQTLTVFLNPELSVSDTNKTSEQIKKILNSDTIKFVSQKELLSQLKLSSPDIVNELENIGDDIQSLVPVYLSAQGSFSEEQVARVNKITGVEKSETTKDKHQDAVSAFKALSWMIRVLLFATSGALLLVFWQLNRSHFELLGSSKKILKLWGASTLQSQLPLLLGGVVSGLLAGVIAGVGWGVFVSFVLNKLTHLSPMLSNIAGSVGILAFVFPVVGGLLGGGLGLLKNDI